MPSYDIAIVGAGPAGSVFALLAARAGYRVLLLDRSPFSKPQIGEMAPPELRPMLVRLGLEHLTRERYCREAPELISVWGTTEPAARNHIFSPYGAGIHIDRPSFDQALVATAGEAGADVLLGRAAQFVRHPRGGYVLDLGDYCVRCRIAVVATGRCGGGLGLSYARRYLDSQIAVAGHFLSRGRSGVSGFVVEAIPGGWFYLAPLSDDSAMVVLVTAASLIPRERRSRLRWYTEALARTEVMRRALNGYALPQQLSVINARACVARSAAGDNWLAIGDARIAPDPLSGQGVAWAIDDAAMAMGLLARLTWEELAETMRAFTLRNLQTYLDHRLRVYSIERRFAWDTYWATIRDHAPISPEVALAGSRDFGSQLINLNP
jgi:flavin-dependent dehydrogenase